MYNIQNLVCTCTSVSNVEMNKDIQCILFLLLTQSIQLTDIRLYILEIKKDKLKFTQVLDI